MGCPRTKRELIGLRRPGPTLSIPRGYIRYRPVTLAPLSTVADSRDPLLQCPHRRSDEDHGSVLPGRNTRRTLLFRESRAPLSRKALRMIGLLHSRQSGPIWFASRSVSERNTPRTLALAPVLTGV
jgi:hypothetical protein